MKSLRARLTFALIAAGAMLIIALCATAFLRGRALLTAQFDDGLRARSAALISQLRWNARGKADFDYKGEFMPEFEHRDGGFYFALWLEKSGRLIEHSHSLDGATLPRFTGTGGQAEFREFAMPDGAPVRAIGVRAPFQPDEDSDDEKHETIASAQPGAVVVIAGNTFALAARLRALAIELAAAGALGLVLIALLVRATLRRGLAPLAQISDLAARLDAEHLDARFPHTGLPAELAPIAARLNDLVARLQDAFARERRFSADVAHELRTPIAELHTLAEVGQGIAPADAETAAFFRDAGAIARRMDGTVSALILLARCESGHQPARRGPVDAGELLATLCAAAEPAARARGIALENGVPRDWQCESDHDLLARLFRILLGNAVEYTGSPGLIALRATEHEITITNSPVALTHNDVPHLFERFWRKDSARSSDAHAGLGLALAAEIARLLDLRLTPELDGDKLAIHIRFS